MKTKIFLLAMAMGMFTSQANAQNACAASEVYDGWHLGMQCWTLKEMTLFEAIEQTRALGLRWLEAFPGQQISPEIREGFGPDISADLRRKVKQKLAESGVCLINFGVYGLSNDPSEARKAFAFAKDMGIKTIVSEPPFDAFEMLDKLCKEYEIRLAIHNHPRPTRYWDPELAAEICKKTSRWIGVCADVGHWVRSGLDPIESLKKLEGRIVDVHMKEIDDGRDLVWGQGRNRAEAIFRELHRQGYQGPIVIEYENHWHEDYIPDLRRCIAYYTQQAADLASAKWNSVFAPDLSNADLKPGSWVLKEGVLIRKGEGDIWTKKTYRDFILHFEFKVDKGTNSGVFLRAAEHTWLPWVEVQIMDSFGKPVDRRDTCGAIYDILAPEVNAVRPAGQWNQMTIVASGPAIQVILNGQPVIEMNLNDWTEAGKNPDGSNNKFNIAYKDLPPEGFLGFQDHGYPIEYRNLKIKECNDGLLK